MPHEYRLRCCAHLIHEICPEALLHGYKEKGGAVERLNAVLHEYGEHIIGRMGIPYRKKGINIVSIALDAPQDTISALAGKLGNIEGLSVKTAYSNVVADE